MLLAPLPMAARSGGTEATDSRPSTALSTPVASPVTRNAGASRQGDESAVTPRASSSPTPTTASEMAITVGPGVVMWTRRTTRDVTTLVTDQTSNGRVAWPSVAPSPCWTSPAAFEAIAMMPSPTTAEPMVATRKAGDLISAGSTSGSATRRCDDREPGAEGDGRDAQTEHQRGQPRPRLGDGRHERGEAEREQDHAGDVDAPRRDGRRLAQAVVAGGREDEREHRRDDVRRAPVLAAEQPGQHHAGRDADPEARAPGGAGPGPFVAGRRGLREDGQPAGEDGRAADALDDPGGDEEPGAVREHARDRAEAEHDQPADQTCGAGRCGRPGLRSRAAWPRVRCSSSSSPRRGHRRRRAGPRACRRRSPSG